jgi:hypothetical protein
MSTELRGDPDFDAFMNSVAVGMFYLAGVGEAEGICELLDLQ